MNIQKMLTITILNRSEYTEHQSKVLDASLTLCFLLMQRMHNAHEQSPPKQRKTQNRWLRTSQGA